MAPTEGNLFQDNQQKEKKLPQENNTRTCDPWTARDFEVQMAEIQRRSTKLCPHCLPDCNHIDYFLSTTSAEFRCAYKCNLTLIPISDDVILAI